MNNNNEKRVSSNAKTGHGNSGKNMPVQKAKNFKGTMRKLFDYIKPYSIKIILVSIFAVASTIFSIVGPKISGKATTEIFEGIVAKYTGVGGINFERIAQILTFLLVLYFISSIFSFIQGFIMSKVAQSISYNLREELSKKINRMPLSYFDKKTTGEVLSRVTNDVDTIGQSLGQSLSQLVSSVTTVIGVLIMMLSISPILTLAAMVILPLSFGVVIIIVKNSQKYFKQQQEYIGHINGQVEEVYGGHTVMKSFNAEEKALKQFNEYNDVLYNSAWKSQFMSGIMMPSMNFIGNIGYVIVAIFGSYLTIRGKIEVGYILSFIQYVRNFTFPIARTAQISNTLQSTVAAAERVFEFLEEEEEIDDITNSASIKHIEGRVNFENVNFGYNSDKVIIHNFSLDVNPGERIAIVGPTGAGKTTIVKLLMRFYELNSGAIKIDGININDFKRNDLRSLVGMVLQDAWLFSGTIKENIRYGNLNASDEEIIKASELAHVHHFIRSLPNSYDMEINEEGTNISQGQKQLLTIARAILSDPKILILDEATSSVDTRTEVLIQEAMNTLMEGRTSFIIAHRLSTIRDADKILVLNEGDVVEQGTHEELLQKEGFYYNLYNSQFEEIDDSI